jgi:hypothetical protein
MPQQVDPEISAAPIVVTMPRQAEGSLADLLQFEAEIRRQLSVNELGYLIANETRRIVDYDQLFLLHPPLIGQRWQVKAVSSLAVVDRNALLIQAVETAVAKLNEPAVARDMDADTLSSDPAISDYPFGYWRWQPLMDRYGQAFAALLLARKQPFLEADHVKLNRIAETTGHAWLALTGGKPARRFTGLTQKRKNWLYLGLLAAALFPVRLSVLAPVEVVAARPYVIAAPFPGVISRIHVAPNGGVKAGEVVLTFEDIKVRNEMQQTLERLRVAKAKIERATSASFADKEEARQIATTRAEYQLAQADYNYATDLLAKSQITAPVDGMAIYSDRRDWEGRAVNAGDPIIQIANPTEIAYHIDLPAKEQMTLRQGGSVKIWLDAQPLWALSGRVEQASYQARPTADGVLAFAIIAKPEGEHPRIGSRGTAKLYGQWVPFSYALLKRPIASVRQFLGL